MRTRINGSRSLTRGFTLIEVMISFIILTVLAGAILSATLPLEKATSRGNVDFDLDRTARKVLAELRREIRQSGTAGAVQKITVPADGATIATPAPPAAAATTVLLTYQMRTGPDATTDWTTDIVVQAVPDAPQYTNVPANSIHRYRLERIQNGQTVVIAKNVSAVSVNRPLSGNSVQITLSLSRPDPQRVDAAVIPPALTQTHSDTIEFYNR